MRTFSPPITWSTKALYGGLGALLMILGFLSYFMEAHYLTSLIIVLVGFLPISILILPYRTRYILTDDSLVCEWIFGRKEIPYIEIEEVKSYHLSMLSIRRFGVSFIGGRYSNSELGKFYAMFGGERDGLLVISSPQTIYGGKIYITPEDEEGFLRELKRRTDAFLER